MVGNSESTWAKYSPPNDKMLATVDFQPIYISVTKIL